MRYFRTGNATRPYSAGGQRVFFETTGRTPGGGMAGIYATSVKAVADGLVASGPPVYEIEEAEYVELKKNSTTILQSSQLSIPVTHRNLAQEVATHVDATELGEVEDVSDLILEGADMSPEADPTPRPARKRAKKS